MTQINNSTLEVEQAVVGAVLVDNSKLVQYHLNECEFADRNLAMIWGKACELIAAKSPADIITVSEALENDTGRKWFSTVTAMYENSYLASNYKHYAVLVRKNYRNRQAVEIAQVLIQNIKEEPASVDIAIKELMSLSNVEKNYQYTIKECLVGAVAKMDEIQQSGATISGIPTGLTRVDEVLGGFHKTDLIILGARPAMGKTALLINMALAANQPVGIISTEQGYEQLGQRFIAIKGSVNASKMRSVVTMDNDDWQRVTVATSLLIDSKIYVNDKPGPTISEVIAQAREWKFKYDISALYVDYVQRIKATNRNIPKHEQVGDVVMQLKELARELDIPVLALAQVNREVEKRPNKRPGMGDLKDSGTIEQEADVIMLLYRDEVYEENTNDKGVAEIDIKKNRHGPTGMAKAYWNAEFMQFKDMVRHY